LRDVGRLAEAAQAFESALEALEAIDPASPAAATTLHALGAMAYHRGQYAVASQQLERAWTIRQAHAVPAHLRANTGFLLARAAWSAGGQQRHALEVAHAARQAFADAGEQYAPQVARVGAWIAERERDRSQDVIRP
jgi:tetratricopeptide (TPR) repeat protein